MPDVLNPGQIEVTNAHVRFGSLAAIDDVSFFIAPGESVAIVGPSGSGKTSLLRLLTGALAGGGVAQVGGRVAIIYQDAKLLPWFTVNANIRLADPTGACEEVIRRWVAAAGLGDKLDAYPYELSGGQRQRVAIVRALARNPDVLLLDEPFSALDFVAKRRLRTLISEISEAQKLTTMTVTHDLDDAVRVANRVLVMRQGRLVGDIVLVDKRPSAILEYRNFIEGLFEARG
ncbi:MAG TPA: ATP-binding cassette domain-containing protein [Candidatus Baltobacteraceae bacterium]|jgi:sulfonate transport system ATP-binding protein|nr:ATP-binding cassette domain-containing protein [Candidatus Baltobacteraceae bacterium]